MGSGLLTSRFRRDLGLSPTRYMSMLVGLAGIVVALFLELRPSSRLATIEWLPQWLTHWTDTHGQFRNFPAYAALAVPFLFLAQPFTARVLVVIALGIFAAAVELAQWFIPTRQFSLSDILWSWAGLLAMFVLFQTGIGLGRRFWRGRFAPLPDAKTKMAKRPMHDVNPAVGSSFK